MRLSEATKRAFARELAVFGVDTKTGLAIIQAVIKWYRTLYSINMKRSVAGKKVGRPRKMTPALVAEARRLRAQGLSYRAIGDRIGITGRTVWYELLPLDKRAKIMKRIRKNVDRWRESKQLPL